MAKTTVRYWAAAKDAAGVAEEQVEAGTLEEALSAVTARRDTDSRLASVLARSSFLIDGAPAGTRPAGDIAVGEGSVIEVLPPFAGG